MSTLYKPHQISLSSVGENISTSQKEENRSLLDQFLTFQKLEIDKTRQ